VTVGSSSAADLQCGLHQQDTRQAVNHPGNVTREVAHLNGGPTSRQQLRLSGGTCRRWAAAGCSSDGNGGRRWCGVVPFQPLAMKVKGSWVLHTMELLREEMEG
jgi:hypothetical protein